MGTLALGSRIILDIEPRGRAFGDVAVPRGAPRGWDFLGNVPVPLRARVRDGVADRVTQHRLDGGEALRCCFPMGQGGVGPFERLRRVRALDDFPRMLVSAEHGNAFNRRFHAEHVAAGHFSACQPGDVASAFSDCGLIDPQGWIGVFAVAPFVLLIDRQRLNGLPVPRRWADLADPMYRDQIVFGGWRREGEACWSQFSKFFLLAMLRLLGPKGLAQIVANVPQLMHSAQMPRIAGTGMSPGGIYVLPWSLADICPRRSHTEVVWPQEGALAYPLWLTVQQAHRERLGFLVDHFYGAELGRYLSDNRYPSLCAEVGQVMPPGARLNWLGWDYLRHRSTAEDVRFASRTFLDAMAARPAEEVLACA
ncbi:MAG: ABC transporter substrate-binding protein [Rhodopseudomonas palustris]|uniref:ABC transporter substrate-binding protein n=1 Tax=Rhodopseudomonas palustris TaxID=1076 RepID=A0A933S1X4_RHOPL|nr:ABC transporter substrate-binding protein [Rhodopseudomonas palustris]